MSSPVYTCEVAFTTNPGTATPSWTNVTPYMLGFAIDRGRQKELDRIDAGTMSVRFRNEDRRFDPSHTTGPYTTAGVTNVLPMKRIRLSALHNAVTYRLFSGFVQSWPQSWQGSRAGFSDVTAVDAFLPLSRVDVGENTTWPQEFSGARISRILDEAGWPAADRSIDTGYSEIAEVTFALGAGVTALDAIRDVAGAELGTFFVDGQGFAVFHDRHHRKAAAYLTSEATFSDGYGVGITYQQDLVLDTGAEQIWNDIQVTATGGETQRAEDATPVTGSQAKYLRRTMAKQVPLARETEAADQAAYLLAMYKEPQNRLDGITITPRSDAMWVQALDPDLGRHITVKRWPQGVGSQITQECSVEKITLRGEPGKDTGGTLRTSWLVSTPAFSAVDWWILGDATNSVLGSTTKPVY
jgi:hypothetical protein